MKLVGVENNLVNTDNSNEDFLIVSDQPIKKYSYYFELEATSTFGLYCAAAIAFVEKDQNNEFVKGTSIQGQIVSYEERETISQNVCYFYYKYTPTKQYYQNSLNLELGGYSLNPNSVNPSILSIFDGKNHFISSSVKTNNSYFNNGYYRLGLGIDIDLDKKITTIRYYSNADNYNTIDKNEELLHQQLSINKIFDPDKLYIVIYPQYLTLRYQRTGHGDQIDRTYKQINYANYKFFFNKDEIKYTHLYEKYNHPATVVEKLEGGVYGKMSDNNFHKLSDHKWDEISKDEKLSLLEQTKGLVPSIDQLKTLDQPIRVVTKAES